MYYIRLRCIEYVFITRPNLAYEVGVVIRYMQSARESHDMVS